jgi:hypothetical protein
MEWNGLQYINDSIVGCCVDQKATSRFSKMIQVFKTKKGEKRKGEKRDEQKKGGMHFFSFFSLSTIFEIDSVDSFHPRARGVRSGS